MKVILQILCASLLASMAMIAAQAQTPAEIQRGVNPEMEGRQRDLQLLDRTMKPREVTNTPTRRRDPKEVMAEVAEDFTGIQVVNNDLGQAASGSAPLKIEFVIKSAAELVERTKRLQENLGRFEPEKGSTPPKLEPITNVEELKGALATLDKLISEFTHNPMFTDASTRDAELFVKARRDLAQIVELSAHIKKNAEQLSKAIKPSS